MLVRLHLVTSRISGVGASEDVAITTHDFWLGSAAGTVDRDAFVASFKTNTDTFCSAHAARRRSSYTYDQYRWYDLAEAGTLFGEPFRVDEVNIVGTENTNPALPPQVAMSVTERTAIRKAWGRFYLCGFTASQIDAYGRWGSEPITAMADAVDAWYTAASQHGGDPVVLHRAISPETAWAPNEITLIQVDDVPDVIRRRRFEITNLRIQRAF